MEKKTERVKIWLTDKELKAIDGKAKKLKMNRSEYVRKLLAECKIVMNPQIDYAEYYRQFKTLGDEFDGELYSLNVYGVFDEKHCEKLSEQMIALSKQLSAEISEKLKDEIHKASGGSE